MPQLQFWHFLPQFFWLAVCFITLYLVMAFVALPRIGSVLAQRKEKIESDLDAAEHALNQVVKLRPSHAGAWSRLASIHQYRGDTARALAAIRKAVKAQPKDGRLQLALAVLVVGVCLKVGWDLVATPDDLFNIISLGRPQI